MRHTLAFRNTWTKAIDISLDCRVVSKSTGTVRSFAVVFLAAAGLAACGGSTSGDAVARVGENTITKATLNHWMSTIVGGDYYEISGRTAPVGLVSDPPNYRVCVAVLETIAARSPAKGRTRPPALRLNGKCQQLYQALKQQALTYLITVQRSIGEGAEQGVTVTDREVKQHFNRLKAERFPKEAELQKYLANRRWTLSDELVLVKRNLLSEKLRQKLLPKLQSRGGEQALIKYGDEATKKWSAKTTCGAGYVVQECKQYKAAEATSVPSPAILLEQIAALAGRSCINRAACG